MLPIVKSAAGYSQNLAHHDDRPTVAMFLGMAIRTIFLGLVVIRSMLVDPGGNARALHPGSTLPRRRDSPLALLAGVFR